MKQAYIVAEGKTDIEVLKKLLPGKVVKLCEFVPGSGSYSARSLASTLLAVKRLPVALVIDADTVDKSVVREKVDFSREWLNQASGGVRFEIFPAVPEIEEVFFYDRRFVENLAHRPFTDTEWRLAKLHPKEVLTNILGNHTSVHKKLLDKLTDNAIRTLQQHHLIERLGAFLYSVVESKEFAKKRLPTHRAA